jgi:hypothetical protein
MFPASKYYVQVMDALGCTSSITEVIIDEISTYSAEVLNADFKYSIIPNPNTGQFSFRVDLKPKDDFSLKLINPLGQIVESRQVQQAEVNHIEKFDVMHLSKGVYVLVITSDWMNATEKIVVQ